MPNTYYLTSRIEIHFGYAWHQLDKKTVRNGMFYVPSGPFASDWAEQISPADVSLDRQYVLENVKRLENLQALQNRVGVDTFRELLFELLLQRVNTTELKDKFFDSRIFEGLEKSDLAKLDMNQGFLWDTSKFFPGTCLDFPRDKSALLLNYTREFNFPFNNICLTVFETLEGTPKFGVRFPAYLKPLVQLHDKVYEEVNIRLKQLERIFH
jgi:hypothetical protein